MYIIPLVTLVSYLFSALLITLIITIESSTVNTALNSYSKTALFSILRLLQSWSSKHFKILFGQLLKLTLFVTLLLFIIGVTSLFLTHLFHYSHLIIIPLIVIFCTLLISYLFIYLFTQFFTKITIKIIPLPVTIILWIFSPITFLFMLLIYKLSIPQENSSKKTDQTKEKELLLHFIQSNTADINPHLKQQLISLSSFTNKKIREIMIPSLYMFCLKESTPLIDCIQFLSEEGYSRIPLYKEEMSQITGIFLYKDLFEFISKNISNQLTTLLKTTPVSSLKKPTLFAPEDKQIQELLYEMQKKKMHMTLVVDEYGQTAGLITIEDILEELLGREIHDEYDQDEEILFKETAPNTYIVQANMTLIDLEKELQIVLPKGEAYETISGYINSTLGAIPKKGTLICHENTNIKIISSTNRKVLKVELQRLTKKNTHN